MTEDTTAYGHVGVAVPGSHHDPGPRVRRVTAADPAEVMEVTVMLHPRRELPDLLRTAARGAARHVPLTRQEFADTYGAAPDDLAAIREYTDRQGLEVVRTRVAAGTVRLRGSVAAVSAAFGVELAVYEHPRGSYRSHVGPVYVTEELAPVVVGVFGLDTRPRAVRPGRPDEAGAGMPEAAGVRNRFWASELAEVYNYPQALDGRGQTVGIVEPDGGFKQADLDAYVSRNPSYSPVVTVVGRNDPGGDPSGATETTLDIETVAGAAPGAAIVVYFGSGFDDQSLIDILSSAIHDQVNSPSVLSASWGANEDEQPASFLTAVDQLLAGAALLGITVCFASGDDGSSGIQPIAAEGHAVVVYPASSPYALACGGTVLTAADALTFVNEVAWAKGGGGVSAAYPVPSYQAGAAVPVSVTTGQVGRGVPDVAGHALAHWIILNGKTQPIGGTSAVAPLWAALIARLNQGLARPVGLMNPLLYGPVLDTGGLRDITTGSNGAYQAAVGWDPCTGGGVPDGQRLLDALRPDWWNPAAVSSGAGRLDIVAIGGDQGIYHWFYPGPSGFGGPDGVPGLVASAPTISSGGFPRLDVFAPSLGGTLLHWPHPGDGFAPPENLGGAIINTPSATSWAANRLDVFATGADSTLYHWWSNDNGALNATWQESLGGRILGSPSVVSRGVGLLDVVATGQDGGLYYWTYPDAGNNGAFTTSPHALPLAGPLQLLGSPSLVSWDPTRLDVFATGRAGSVYHWWLDERNPDFGGPEALGFTVRLSGPPSAVSWASNRLDVFTSGNDGQLYHWWYPDSSGEFSPTPELLTGPTVEVGTPTAVSWADNRLDVFAGGSDGQLYHWWYPGTSGFGGPEQLPQP